MKRVVIIGGRGQDGRLLNGLLSARGDVVTALGRGDIDLKDTASIGRLLEESSPHEVYYLSAHHHSSQDQLGYDEVELYRESATVHVEGLVNFLEAICKHFRGVRLFYAASSLVFGSSSQDMQDEATPLDPRCVYGITKAAGLRICRYYREKHGVFASGGILYNHESPLRQAKFVIPKIIDSAVAIAGGSREKLRLGDLSARVDWGYAPDYVDAMTRILSLPDADDYIIATGKTHSVGEAVEMVFSILGLDWRANIEEHPGILTRRRAVLCGDSTKLRATTGWSPSVGFKEMLTLILTARRNG